MNLLLVFILLLTIRLSSVFLVKTFYVPDEYWQSLEVAHRLTFGYGYLTWEWIHGIRSYVYPLAISGIYKLLAIFNLDSAKLLILSPRILQATLSAYSDYRFFMWCKKTKWALFLIIVSWFWFYIGSRTLLNTLETALTTIALSYFPWCGEGASYLWPAALCCYIRPTAALIWLPLVVCHLYKSKLSWPELIFKHFFPVGSIVAAICIGIDSWMHGQILVTPYEFLKYNIVNNIGSFYGSNPWYWYLTIGLPSVLGINFIAFLIGIIETVRYAEFYRVRKYLLITIIISLCAYSAIEHKEFRFISALLPLCLYIIADTLTKWSYKASKCVLWLTAGFILAGNAIPVWYFGTINHRGPLEVMEKLHEISKEYRDELNHPASIYFLMPCHSTPYYSHIHQNVTMKFLACDPNLKQYENYVDVAEQFYMAPMHWLRTYIPVHPRTALPSHVVMFEPLAPKIEGFLSDYKELYKIPYGGFLQPRTGDNILIFQRLRTGEENLYNREEFDEIKFPIFD